MAKIVIQVRSDLEFGDKYQGSITLHDVPVEWEELKELKYMGSWKVIQYLYGAMLAKLKADKKLETEMSELEDVAKQIVSVVENAVSTEESVAFVEQVLQREINKAKRELGH